ncbi:hypothetical protein Glove_99g48 [Diversispora epigaea]|uniref:Uncharacterized protein n=1 Tax=Diversispora epigaea TaxID=1348612 RepID=A0A397JEP0_9GLOM|nr:hypothetical protein Glove_99g48 [Diversispora epigaea]
MLSSPPPWHPDISIPGSQVQNRKKTLKNKEIPPLMVLKPFTSFQTLEITAEKVMVLSKDNSTDECKLSQDILSINTAFIC